MFGSKNLCNSSLEFFTDSVLLSFACCIRCNLTYICWVLCNPCKTSGKINVEISERVLTWRIRSCKELCLFVLTCDLWVYLDWEHGPIKFSFDMKLLRYEHFFVWSWFFFVCLFVCLFVIIKQLRYGKFALNIYSNTGRYFAWLFYFDFIF